MNAQSAGSKELAEPYAWQLKEVRQPLGDMEIIKKLFERH